MKRWPQLLFFRGSLIFPFILNFVLGGWVLWEIKNVVLATESVNHSHKTMMAISQVEESMSQSESALRGFLLTNQQNFVDTYESESSKVPSVLAQLEAIVQEEPVLKERVREAQSLVNSWLTLGKNIVAKVPTPETKEWLSNSEGSFYTNEVLRRLNQVKQSEAKTYKEKSEFAKAVSNRTFNIGLFAFSVLALWMSLAFKKLVSQEIQLRKSETRFKSLFENAFEAIVVFDRDGIICMANRKTEPHLGYAPDELVGKPIDIIIPEAHKNNLSQAADIEVEASIRRKDGSTFPADVSIGPAGTKEKPLVIANIRNISDKKKTEDRLRFAAQFSETMQQSLDIQETLNQAAQLCSPALGDWCMIHFFESGIGHPCTQWSSNSYHSQNLKKDFSDLCTRISLQNSLTSPELVQLGSLPLEQMDPFQKKIFELGVQSYLLLPLFAHNHNVGVMAVFSEKREYTDIDVQFAALMASRAALGIDNARLYKKACDAINARNEILAIVSHDLKNPVGSIQMAADMMGEDLRSMQIEPHEMKEEIHFLLQTMERSASQSLYLINDLLDFARVDSGNLKIETRISSIGKVLENASELFMPIAKEKHIHLITQLTDREDRAPCDKRRLLQALSNLVGNSIKFTPRGGTIVLREEVKEDSILISVEDTGVGMPPETIKHIFERFWQPSESRKQGSGLGLFITKGIVEAHGGKIWVESNPNCGSRFHIQIPKHQPPQRPGTSAQHLT